MTVDSASERATGPGALHLTLPEAVVFLDGAARLLTREQLDATLARRARGLASAGISNQVVALSLPSNADLAVDVLAAMMVGTAAPMNPGATTEECKAYLTDLRPRILITSGFSAAAAAARQLGVDILEPEELAQRQADVELVPPDPAGTALLLPTSGTTGRPKLVPLTHSNLAASARNVASSLQLTSDDRCLGLMPYYHVHGLVAGLMAPLAAGGSVIATGGFNASRIRSWLEDLQPTWYTGVPTIHRAVLDSILSGPRPVHRLRFVRSSSAPLAPQLMEELEQTLGIPAIEAYGMTEASHQIATNPLPPASRRPGTVGVASGTTLSVLTDGAVHTDSGRTGEVVIKGPGVITGYRDNPEATVDAFHEGWFRTGDLGQLDAAGFLHLVGRHKEMINRGGEKIAPREVEEVLLGHPTVAQAVAFACSHPTLGEDVAALVVLRSGSIPTTDDLIGFARARLAAFKVPRQIVFAERIPVGPTGKPQRNRMAEQLGLTGGVSSLPTDGGGSVLESIWAEFLKLERVPHEIDFFALGGDSLRALALISAVEERLAVVVPIEFFADSAATLRRMEAMIATREPAGGPEPDGASISFSEEGILARSTLDPDGVLFNIPTGLRLDGPIDPRRLESALQRVVAAHEALRTSYPRGSGTRERSVSLSTVIPFDVHHVRTEKDVAKVFGAEARRPFDIQNGPLVRVSLAVLDPAHTFLQLTAHHSVLDGLARDFVLEALADAYRQPEGEARAQLTPTTSLGALAGRQRSDYETGRFSRQRRYWLEQLTPLPEPLELLGPHREDRAWNGDIIDFQLGAVTSDALRTVASSLHATPFTVFLAGVVATLSRLTGGTDIVVGTPAANRHRRGAAKIAGMLANLLPLRVSVAGDPTFEALIATVRKVTLGALVNQEYPYERMLDDVRPEGAFDADPLFRVACQLRRSAPTPDFGDDIAVGHHRVHNGTALTDLSFDLREDESGVAGTVEFATDVFDRDRVTELCSRLRRLLTAALLDVSQPLSRLPLLGDDELRQIISHGRGPEPERPAGTVVDLILAQVKQTPEAPAVLAGNTVVSYRELDLFTGSVALALRRRGIGRGDRVAIMPARDERMIILMLGVLRAGAAYLPLDRSYPAHRLQAMVGAAQPRLLVHTGTDPTSTPPELEFVNLDELLQAGANTGGLPSVPEPADAACVLFTSGSTGTPKAVAIPHAAITNLLSWALRTFEPGELARVLVSASLSFDYSLFEVYPPLAVGGCLVVVENVLAIRDDHSDVSLVATVPAALRVLLDDGAIPSGVQTIASAGEPLSGELAARLLALPQRPRLVNHYGPTEATVLCCATDVGLVNGPPPIGQPVDGAVVLVMDRLGRSLPSGFTGELWIGGRGLAGGYLGDPQLSALRFVEAELPGLGRLPMYRTGDLGWADRKGTLHFVRRLDDQLTVRGIRMEPGDIEAALGAYPGVGLAVVYAVGDDGARELHAAITTPGEPVDIESLRAFAAQRLPHHMVPRRIRVIDRLPLTPRGKMDRRALAALPLDLDRAESRNTTDGVERLVLSTWQRLLRRPDLSVDTDFFAAGGNSLLALELLTEVENLLDVRLPLAWFVDGSPTVRRLAVDVRRATPIEGTSEASDSLLVVPVRPIGNKPPIFFIYAHAEAALSARFVAESLGTDRPLYAVAPIWTTVSSIQEIVEQTASVIAETVTGMVHLVGHSLGGLVAYGVAERLEATGHRVGALAMVDTGTPDANRLLFRRRLRLALGIPLFWRQHLGSSPFPDTGLHYFPAEKVMPIVRRHRPISLRRQIEILTTSSSRDRHGPLLGWDDVHRGKMTQRAVPGDHNTILQPPAVHVLTQLLDECMEAAEREDIILQGEPTTEPQVPSPKPH